MNKAAARLRILHLCERLYEATDPAEQEMLYLLLVAEETKLDSTPASFEAAFTLRPIEHRVGR